LTGPDKNPIEPSDYRLTDLSIIPILSKVYEKVIKIQLVYYLETNQLLSKHQSGFRKGHCTISTRIKIKDDIINAMGRGEVTLAVMTNFSKRSTP